MCQVVFCLIILVLNIFSICRYVTLQRGNAVTEPTFAEDDSINQVGDSISHHDHDTELLFSLAKFKKSKTPVYNRVKRSLDIIDIVYPSDAPLTDSPPTSKKPSLIVSNDVSIVYPQSYNPKRDDRQSNFDSLLSGDFYKPAATILPVRNDLTTTSLSKSMTLSSISSTSTSPSSSTNQHLDPSPTFDPATTTVTQVEFMDTEYPDSTIFAQTTSSYSEPTTLIMKENNEDESSDEEQNNEDYEDWGVVVSVVKSVSESDSSVKLIQQHETTPTDYMETTTVKDEVTTMQHQLNDNVTLKPKSLPFKTHPTTNLHPFLGANKISNTNATFGHHKIHPFLHQIKSPNAATPTNGATIAPSNATTTNQTTAEATSASTSTSATGLFNRFSFLNKDKRPDSTGTSKLKSLQSRLAGFKRPSFRPSGGFKKPEKPKVDDISNEIEDQDKPKTTESSFKLKKTSFFDRFKSKKSLFHPGSDNDGSSTTKDVSKPIEKPRPKRLPSPFGGSRPSSLFKPRPNRFFSHSHVTESTVQTTTSTEKQTVGDIIAQLNGDNEEEEKPATLRPHSFKPKSGVSNKIREHLLAELAEVKDDTEDDVNNVSDSSTPEVSSRTTPKDNSLHKIVPTRLSGLDRKHLSPLSSSRTRLRSRSKLQATDSSLVTNIDQAQTSGAKNILTEKSLSNKLGVTVVSPARDHVSDTLTHDSPGSTVEFVHDREKLTTKELEDSSTNSPFQVLLDASADMDESHADTEEEDHVHDLVHQHHPEIHFRHLNPDVLPKADNAATLDMFLPTMPAHTVDITEDNTDVTETDQTVDTAPASTAAAFLPTVEQKEDAPEAKPVTRSRGRSRYRPRPSSSSSSSSGSSSRSSVAEQRRNRIQIRRRNRNRVSIDTSSDESNKVSSEAKDSANNNRSVTRQRSRFRSRTQQTASEASDNSERSSGATRFTNPRRLRSRARSSASQAKAPEFKSSSNLRIRARGGTKVVTTTTTEREPEVERELIEEVATVPNSITDTIDIEDKQEQILEGKSTTLDVETTTEGVVTTLTINSNEENSEVELDTTIKTEEVSTLSPGKFKPKFGAETRNKLREKLRQELLKNQTASAVKDVENISDIKASTNKVDDSEDIHDNFSDLPVFDTEFSDFDIDPTIVEAPTTAIIDFENDDYFDSLPFSQPQSRSQRKINEVDIPNRFSQRKNMPKRKRSHNSQTKHNTLFGSRKIRYGRSTLGDTYLTTVKEGLPDLMTDVVVADDTKKAITPPLTTSTSVKPFLLRGGKGYNKNILESKYVDHKFSAFRPGIPSIQKKENRISGPNVDLNIVNKNKINGKKKNKFGSKSVGVKEEVKPSVDDDESSKESVNVDIYLDSDYSSTFAPNTLTTSGLNYEKLSKPRKGFKKRFKLRKIPKKTTSPKEELITQSSQTLDKVDHQRPNQSKGPASLTAAKPASPELAQSNNPILESLIPIHNNHSPHI